MNFKKNAIKKFLLKFLIDINYQLSLAAFCMIIGAGFVWFGVWFNLHNKFNDSLILSLETLNLNNNLKESTNKVPRKTDGVLVDKDQSDNKPVAVIIENLASENVRPQFGLQKAEIVYEMLVEGGITRFLAIYSDLGDIEQIGPVRSARPTFSEFTSEYNALYVHAGGSPQSLAAISGLQIPDCSALTGDSKYFWRYSNNYAPHNLMTSGELLFLALRDKQFSEENSNFDSWLFSNNKKKNKASEMEKYVKVSFSTPEYEVTWKYNHEQNVYQRYYQEQEHKDALTNSVITTKNVIVQIVPPAMDAGEKGRINFDVNGEGKAYIFNNGEKTDATWKKNGRMERTKFYNDQGEEISLLMGNIWIEILPLDKTIENN